MAEAKRKTTKLKELLAREGKPTIVSNAMTARAARLMEAAGFENAFLGAGLTIGAITGRPDDGTITVNESVTVSKWIASATEMPIWTDTDACFGGIFQVKRAVEDFIAAGVAGIKMEDQPFIGKRFGGMVGKEVIPVDEAVAKFRIAVDTKRELDPDFQIVGRCDSLTAADSGGIPEVIERLQAYKQAGVDALHIEGPRNAEEVLQVRKAVDGPLMCTFYNFEEEPSLQAVADMGLCAAIYPNASGIIYRFMWNLFKAMQERGHQALIDFRDQYPDAGPPIGGRSHIRELEEMYLPAEKLDKYDRPVPAGAGIVNPHSTL